MHFDISQKIEADANSLRVTWVDEVFNIRRVLKLNPEMTVQMVMETLGVKGKLEKFCK